MGDALAKSILMGQWPMSRIKWMHVSHFTNDEELIQLLKWLPKKKNYNKKARLYWLPRLKNLL